MTEPLKLEWEHRRDTAVVTDDYGEVYLTADEWEATYKAGDMEWTFTVDHGEGQADAQWIAEMAAPVLEAFYQRIGDERKRRYREKEAGNG